MTDEVSISSIKGFYGVAIGQEDLFLYVEEVENGYRFKLEDLHNPPQLTTSWVTLDSAEKLSNSPKAKLIRESVKTRCGPNSDRTLDKVIRLVQDNEEKWKPEEPKQQENPIAEVPRGPPCMYSTRGYALPGW